MSSEDVFWQVVFLSPMSKNSVLEEFKSKKISSHPGRDLLKSTLKVRND